MNILNKFSTSIVKIIFYIFIFIYLVLNILFSVHVDNLSSSYLAEFNFGLNVYVIIGTLLLFLILYVLIKNNFFNINEKKLIIIFLIICAILGLYWIFSNDITLNEADDAQNCFNLALNLANGNLNVLNKGYYISIYPNNVGLITYDLLHIKLFGEVGALYSIRIVNLIFVLFAYYYLYKICDVLFKGNGLINSTLIFLMFGNMHFVFYAFYVYGNCLSYSLGIISFYYLLKFIKEENVNNLIISTICIVLSIFIKQNSLIIMIGEFIYLVLYMINNKKLLPLIFMVLMLLGVYGVTSGLQKYWGNKVGLDYSETKLPTICWVAYGVNYNENTPGHYTNEFEVFHVNNGYYAKYTSIEAKDFINMTLTRFKEDKSVAIKYYINKFLVSWCDPQFETFGQYRNSNHSYLSSLIIGGGINHLLDIFWDSMEIILSIGLLIYVIRNKNKNLFELSCAVIIIGGFLFHIVWEVKSIYLYQYYMYLLPYGSYGLVKLLNKRQ